MRSRCLSFLLLLAMPLVAGAADGVPGATVKPDGARAAMMERCKADPEKCRAERRARLEACKANPEKCRSERLAMREKWCAANPEKCKQMKARVEQCKANPEKCRAERQARFEQRFKKADLDGNGTISRAEAEKAMPRLVRRFERLDANSDGQITRAEFESARKSREPRKNKVM